MEAGREWLEELRGHLNDQKWLASHADFIYSTLEFALNYPPQVGDAIESLIAVCPFMFTRSDFKRWSSLLIDALLNAQLFQDEELQSRIWTQMGENYYMAGQHSEARDAFEAALQHAQQGHTDEMLLSAYVGIIKLQSTRLDAGFNQQFVQEALALSRQVNDRDACARIYSELVGVHTRRHETLTAIGYGQTAYCYWHKKGKLLDKARTAFMLAEAYRIAGHLRQAEYFLDEAASLFNQANYSPAYWLITYETGILYLHLRKYQYAQQWLMIAVQEAAKLEQVHNLALSYHSLGIALTGLKQFDEAEKQLQAALAIWEQLDHHYHYAHAYHALGYLEGRRNRIQQALDYFETALRESNKIPGAQAKQTLQQMIRETLAELNEPT
jgi:tetratricopeptide (TPR) repeat protein